jgi:hypothetical protein
MKAAASLPVVGKRKTERGSRALVPYARGLGQTSPERVVFATRCGIHRP